MTRCALTTFVLVLAFTFPAAAQTPQRVVSIGGDLTEIVYALGAGDTLVGADTTSTWPSDVDDVAKVGYMRQLAVEGILSLAPDLVLAAADAGPPSVLERLEQAGIAVAIAPDDASVEGVAAKIRFVGAALGRATEAEAAVARFEAEMAAVETALANVALRPTVLFLLSGAAGSLMAGGGDTAADAVIRLARGTNAVEGFNGYRPLNAEAMIAAAPDVLLLPSHAVAEPGRLEALLAEPALAATPAASDGRVVVIDSLLLLGFGPRTPQAVQELARALHPDLAEGPADEP